MAEKFYLTTPIYYVNARPHIGHAYTTIVADVLARRHRLLGDDTFFLTGTDEHGQKIERSAAAAGIPPQQFADQVSKSFEDLWKRMGITNDAYIRTTDEKHKRGVQKLFAELYERGFIYLASYTGQYCVSDEAFVDVAPGEPCPDCGRITETLTEENFFFKLSEFQKPLIELIESNELLITPDTRRNEVLSFLRAEPTAVNASKYGRKLELDIAGRLRLINDARRNNPQYDSTSPDWLYYGLTTTGTSFIIGGLKNLSISRSSFSWGIPVPEPAASAAAQKHIIYVWLDALANYMTAIGYGSDDPAEQAKFEKFWPADLHLVGKEIIRFHCVYWPAFLLAADLPLPKAITAHGWLLFDNSKMSKSKGNIVRTETILAAFGEHVYAKQFAESTKSERDLFASDVLRYFLLREIPFGQDGSFSFEALITRYNADLANGYGNLVSRTLSMIQKYSDGVIPKASDGYLVPKGQTEYTNLPLSSPAEHGAQRVVKYFYGSLMYPEVPLKGMVDLSIARFRHYDFQSALRSNFFLIGELDEYITQQSPWKLSDVSEINTILYTSTESIRLITALLYPILPFATANVWAQLGLGDIEQAARNGELNNLEWGGLKPGTKLGPLAPIFPRADKGLAQIMTDMENPAPEAAPEPTSTTDPAAGPRTASLDEPIGTLPVAGSTAHTAGPATTPSHKQASPSAPFDTTTSQTPIGASADATNPADASPQSQQITIDDFAKIELRVAQILVAERIPKADKLLRLEVDLGYEKRQILSGIAEWYAPEDLVGRRIVVITNLAPRKMRGLESHGMLLAASNGEDGKPVLATFNEEIALGSRLK